ncbi:MAG: PEP-CTERM sorting domain-containing protein [Cyanobacteria bacterium P01_B01_bin.77]
MINRLDFVVLTGVVLTVWRASAVEAQTVDYDVIVDVTSGPLAGERYSGVTSVELANELRHGLENDSSQPLSITFDFGGTKFTDADDSRDVDANSPRANFHDGDFIGATYIVARFGDNPTDIPLMHDVAVDGFAIDNHDFGYAVGANLYRGVVNYTLSSESFEPTNPESQSVPEPAFWLGLATVTWGGWLTRRFNKETGVPG